MADEPRVTRAGILRVLASSTLVRLGTAAGVAAVSAAAAAAEAADATDVVMIIRHGEKPLTDGPPHGVTLEGVQNANSLTVVGWARAGALAAGFAYPQQRWGLPVPTAIYAASPHGDGALRALQTIGPLANRLQVPINTTFGKGDEAKLAAELIAGHGPRLVCWEHHAIPEVVGSLGTIAPSPAQSWDNERYDLIWIFVKQPDGTWRFRVIPQRLLVGDTTSP
jgi:hypothetical protein